MENIKEILWLSHLVAGKATAYVLIAYVITRVGVDPFIERTTGKWLLADPDRLHDDCALTATGMVMAVLVWGFWWVPMGETIDLLWAYVRQDPSNPLELTDLMFPVAFVPNKPNPTVGNHVDIVA